MRNAFYSFTDSKGSTLNITVDPNEVTINVDSHDGIASFVASTADMAVVGNALFEARELMETLDPLDEADDVTVDESDTDDLDTFEDDEEEQFDSTYNRRF